MAFIDADEFLVIHDNDNSTSYISNILEQYEEYGGLAVNWIRFVSSGHIKRPKNGVLKNYCKCLPFTTQIKSIVNTKFVQSIGPNVREFKYKDGKFCVDENYHPIKGPRTVAPTHRHISLHHYVIKSKGDFEMKIKRGSTSQKIGIFFIPLTNKRYIIIVLDFVYNTIYTILLLL